MSILCQMFGAYQKHHPCLRSRVASKYPLPFCQMRDGHFGYLHGHPSIVTDAPKLSRQGREQGVETSKTTHWRRKEVKFWPRWTKMYPNVVNSIVNLGDGLGLLMAFRFFPFLPGWAPTRSASKSNSNHRMWNDSAKTRSKGRDTSAKLCGSPRRNRPQPLRSFVHLGDPNQLGQPNHGQDWENSGASRFLRLFVADLQRHIRYFMEPWSEPKTAELKLEFQTYFRQQLRN